MGGVYERNTILRLQIALIPVPASSTMPIGDSVVGHVCCVRSLRPMGVFLHCVRTVRTLCVVVASGLSDPRVHTCRLDDSLH